MGEHIYKTGDRVRVVKGIYIDVKGVIAHSSVYDDTIQHVDLPLGTWTGNHIKFPESYLEPLRWWKFWRSRKV